MLKKVNDYVDVIASFKNEYKRTPAIPHYIRWKGIWHKVETFGMYHPIKRGTGWVHCFAFSSDKIAFRVEADPDTLEWRLTEVFYP
jgi:hypothetical protein